MIEPMELILMALYVTALGAAFIRFRRVLHDPLAYSGGSLVLVTAIGTALIDKVVIVTGRTLGEGELLAGLNLGRLWLNVLVLPLLLVTYVDLTGRLKIKAARTRTVAGMTWVLAWLLVGLQAWNSLPQLAFENLSPVEFGGLLFYEPAAPLAHPGTLAANIAGLLLGLLILLRTGWPAALIGTGLILAERALFPQPFIIDGAIEALWLWSLVLTEWRAQREGLGIKRSELDTRLERLG